MLTRMRLLGGPVKQRLDYNKLQTIWHFLPQEHRPAYQVYVTVPLRCIRYIYYVN